MIPTHGELRTGESIGISARLTRKYAFVMFPSVIDSYCYDQMRNLR